jgi:hypothetical protein
VPLAAQKETEHAVQPSSGFRVAEPPRRSAAGESQVRPARSKPNIGWFDIDDVGIARAQLAQLMSYWFSVAFVVEQLLTLLIG